MHSRTPASSRRSVSMGSTLFKAPVAAVLAALAGQAFAQAADPPITPVTSMRPSKHYIDNSKLMKPRKGVGVEQIITAGVQPIYSWAGRVDFGDYINYHTSCPQPAVAPLPVGDQNYDGCARNNGNFRTNCAPSHMAYDDPIVYPGQNKRAHLHLFFGNTMTKGTSTAVSIRTTGNSTCSGGTNNRSSYWVPALIYVCDTPAKIAAGCNVARNGWPIDPPTTNIVYYKGGHGNGAFTNDGRATPLWTMTHEVEVLPVGFNMIGGIPSCTTASCATGSFECWNSSVAIAPRTVHIPGSGGTTACPALTTQMSIQAVFKNCWNGIDPTGVGGNSHLGPNSGGDDPACTDPGFQNVLPGISYHMRYTLGAFGDANNVNGRDDIPFWRLSSDNYDTAQPAGYSMHGDWFNGWKPEIMAEWVENCLRKGMDCLLDNLGPVGPHDAPTAWRAMPNPRFDR